MTSGLPFSIGNEDKGIKQFKVKEKLDYFGIIDKKYESRVKKFINALKEFDVIDINKDVNNKSTLIVEITNPDDKLEENMQANCTVIIEKAENVVGLPIEAVQKDDAGRAYANVVQDDGSTKQVYINTGISDDYYVEITSGLNVGDRVQIVKSTTTVVNKENKK